MIRSLLLMVSFGKQKGGQQKGHVPATGAEGRTMQATPAAQASQPAKPAPQLPAHTEQPAPKMSFKQVQSAVKNVFNNNGVNYGSRTPTQKEHQYINDNYRSISGGRIGKFQAAAPKPKGSERFKAAIGNIKNLATSAIDNTVGYAIAKHQNYKTKNYFANTGGNENDKIVYLMHGVFQNQGSQWRYAKQLQKEGYKVVHLKGNHLKTREHSVNEAYRQIQNFHERAKIKDPKKIKAYFSGHSGGADTGIYMAADERSKKYNIQAVQARAPAPYGIKPRTIGQKILMPFVSGDDITTFMGKKGAIDMYNKQPIVPVDIVAGYSDGLVTPQDAYYDKAMGHYILPPGANSTHFATSGVNNNANKYFVSHMKKMTR